MGLEVAHMFTLGHVLDHVRRTREWVVIVAASSCASALARVLPGMLPPGAHVAGRTVMLLGGGRLTIVEASHAVSGSGYRVMFLGFDGDLTPRDEIALYSWREASEGTVGLGERPGDLRIS